MKKSSSKPAGNQNKQTSNVKMNAPAMHDDNMRRQPPTPQDIQRVQPVSQTNQKNHPDKSFPPKSRKSTK
ncbi:MAG TPA: hypothetical protein VMZ69_00205 [Saprospiraceae bacterium]|nr:hypothetical protein [Saprospiraceae bacterium]